MPAVVRSAQGAAAVPPAMQAALLAQQRQQAAAALDAARAHLHATLQQRIDAWPALDEPAACRIGADGTDCNHAALHEHVLAQAEELHALLAAHRRFEPLADALQIEYRDGRYRAVVVRSSGTL